MTVAATMLTTIRHRVLFRGPDSDRQSSRGIVGGVPLVWLLVLPICAEARH